MRDKGLSAAMPELDQGLELIAQPLGFLAILAVSLLILIHL